jgi:hypothetical protein
VIHESTHFSNNYNTQSSIVLCILVSLEAIGESLIFACGIPDIGSARLGFFEEFLCWLLEKPGGIIRAFGGD